MQGFGTLIIQTRLGTSDRETVRQIQENPYLQYFIGLPRFQTKAPFDPSLITLFRKRIGNVTVDQINEDVVSQNHGLVMSAKDKRTGTGKHPHRKGGPSSPGGRTSGGTAAPSNTDGADPGTEKASEASQSSEPASEAKTAGEAPNGGTQRYRARTGHYPERVLVDRIDRTRKNRAYCKEHGIRMSGPRLGRKASDPDLAKAEKKAAYQDNKRSFRLSKRCCKMGLVMEYLDDTVHTAVSLSVLTTNLFEILDAVQSLFCLFYWKVRNFAVFGWEALPSAACVAKYSSQMHNDQEIFTLEFKDGLFS